jgi:hypothetical protein
MMKTSAFEKHDDFFSVLNIIKMTKVRRMKWTVCGVHIESMRHACTAVIGKFEGKKSVEKPRLKVKGKVFPSTGLGGP